MPENADSLTTDGVNKVLVVSRYFAPMRNTRAVQAERAVEALRGSGIDVRVISDAPGGKLNRGIAEAGLYLNWTGLAWHGSRPSRARALENDWRPDCVLSMSTPFDSHLLGHNLAKHFDVPWAAFLSDPWPIWTAPGPYAGTNKGLYRGLQFRAGERLLKECDALLAPTLEQIELQRQVYPALADIPGVETLHCISAESATTTAEEPVGICHLGQITPERCSEALIDGIKSMAAALPGEKNVLTFVGNVADEIRHALADETARGSVEFVPPVSSERSLELMRSAKTLLLVEADMAKSPFLPSKITDYAAAQRPILIVSNDSSALARITHGQVGVNCVPHDAQRIGQCLVEAHKQPAQAPRDLAKSFTPDQVASRYRDALHQAVQHFRAH